MTKRDADAAARPSSYFMFAGSNVVVVASRAPHAREDRIGTDLGWGAGRVAKLLLSVSFPLLYFLFSFFFFFLFDLRFLNFALPAF